MFRGGIAQSCPGASVVVVRFALLPAAFCALIVSFAGCGGGDGGDRSDGGGDGASGQTPALGREGGDEAAVQDLGFPALATRNTTRVAGADPITDAANVAQAVFPSRDDDSRPRAVTLVDSADWRVAISAAQLMAAPLRAPLLFSEGGELPVVTERALGRMIPTGAKEAGGAQVIGVGAAAAAEGYKTTKVEGADHAAMAQAIDRLHSAAAGKPSRAVLVASSEQSGFSMPAAGWAAKSGDPVLWVTRDAIPTATRAAITAHKRPRIYVLGPEQAISKEVLDKLSKLGATRRISGADPVANAIAFARFSDGTFGWNVVDPGHGLVFMNSVRPLDAAAAAPLSASGTYGPQLLLTAPNVLPAPLQEYLLDIQPGYDSDPVRGVYNHGWMIGDERAVAIDVQARIDALLEIQAVGSSDGA